MFTRGEVFLHGATKMLEIVGATFIADQPTIFSPPSASYIEKEMKWYLSKSLSIVDMPDPPKAWLGVSGINGAVNSNYGHLFLSADNGYQSLNVMKELKRDRWSRRAVAIYQRPSMHRDAVSEGMNDFVCTNAVQFLIRDNKLVLVVQMRSNDAVWGYKNDVCWHRWCQEFILRGLNEMDMELEAGDIIWHAASLHVYERHFHYVKEWQEGIEAWRKHRYPESHQ